MRLKPGDLIAVFDGRGSEAAARVEAIAGKRVTVRAIERRTPAAEPAVAITLAQALLKSEKMDRVIRDAVMLGAAAIRPLATARIEVSRGALERGSRSDRWNRTVVSSAKQCGRAFVPAVMPVVDFSTFLASERDALCLLFVEPTFEPARAEHRLVDLRTFETRVPARATVVIGPEGGWEPEEVAQAAKAGATLVTLGHRTWRADAADPIAIALLQYVWNDL